MGWWGIPGAENRGSTSTRGEHGPVIPAPSLNKLCFEQRGWEPRTPLSAPPLLAAPQILSNCIRSGFGKGVSGQGLHQGSSYGDPEKWTGLRRFSGQTRRCGERLGQETRALSVVKDDAWSSDLCIWGDGSVTH